MWGSFVSSVPYKFCLGCLIFFFSPFVVLDDIEVLCVGFFGIFVTGSGFFFFFLGRNLVDLSFLD